jgi:hypothetical protein
MLEALNGIPERVNFLPIIKKNRLYYGMSEKAACAEVKRIMIMVSEIFTGIVAKW